MAPRRRHVRVQLEVHLHEADGDEHSSHALAGRQCERARRRLPQHPDDESSGRGRRLLCRRRRGRTRGGRGLSSNVAKPDSARLALEAEGYVTDIRGPAQFGTLPVFLDTLESALITQAESFLHLVADFDPHVGFACFRLSVELQYLAMVEIQKIQELATDGREPDTPVRRRIAQHFAEVDTTVQRLFERVAPRRWALVSDHGIAPFTHEASIDPFLRQNGRQSQSSPHVDYARRVSQAVARRARRRLGRPPTPRGWGPFAPLKQDSTRAFGNFFDSGNFAGVFVNDRERFGGPVTSQHESELLVSDICETLNSDREWQSYGVSAEPFRAAHRGTRFEHRLPDIRLTKPDSMFFSGKVLGTLAPGASVRANSHYREMTADLSGRWYPHTGVKGRHPLLITDIDTAARREATDPSDLRLVYELFTRSVS